MVVQATTAWESSLLQATAHFDLQSWPNSRSGYQSRANDNPLMLQEMGQMRQSLNTRPLPLHI